MYDSIEDVGRLSMFWKHFMYIVLTVIAIYCESITGEKL